MADLSALIRIRKHNVDEKRRVVAQLFRETEVLEKQKEVVEKQMAHEIEMAKVLGTVEAQSYLGKYLEGARKKVMALAVSIKKMEARIAAAQEEVRELFTEQKKIEITQAARKEREAAALKKKEDQTLDDISIDRFVRKEED